MLMRVPTPPGAHLPALRLAWVSVQIFPALGPLSFQIASATVGRIHLCYFPSLWCYETICPLLLFPLIQDLSGEIFYGSFTVIRGEERAFTDHSAILAPRSSSR